jgi:hypothetical protein
VNKLLESIEKLPSDDLRHAASLALGSVINQDVQTLLPILLKAIRTNTVITSFLSEALHPVLESNTDIPRATIHDIWVALKSMAGTMQENSRLALAGSMAILAAMSAETGFSQLRELACCDSPSARYIAMTSYCRITRQTQMNPIFLQMFPLLASYLQDADVVTLLRDR